MKLVVYAQKIIYENIGKRKVAAVFITFHRHRYLYIDACVSIIICLLLLGFNMRAVKFAFFVRPIKCHISEKNSKLMVSAERSLC